MFKFFVSCEEFYVEENDAGNIAVLNESLEFFDIGSFCIRVL